MTINTPEAPSTAQHTILLVVGSIAFLAVLCVATICYCAVRSVNLSEGLGSTLNTTCGTLIGALTAMLMNTRSTAPVAPGTAPQTTEKVTTETTTVSPDPGKPAHVGE